MRILWGLSIVVVLILFIYPFRWETEGQERIDGDLYLYKSDRFTGQRWRINISDGQEETPFLSQEKFNEQIVNSRTDDEQRKIDEAAEEIQRLIPIKEKNAEAYQKYHELRSRHWEEPTDPELLSQHKAYIDASNKISELEDVAYQIDKGKHEKIIIDLASKAWDKRNLISDMRDILITVLVILISLIILNTIKNKKGKTASQ